MENITDITDEVIKLEMATYDELGNAISFDVVATDKVSKLQVGDKFKYKNNVYQVKRRFLEKATTDYFNFACLQVG
jgi:hypothetical protein